MCVKLSNINLKLNHMFKKCNQRSHLMYLIYIYP